MHILDSIDGFLVDIALGSTRGQSLHENSEWTELAYHSSDVALSLRTLPEGALAKGYAEDMQQNLTDLALCLVI